MMSLLSGLFRTEKEEKARKRKQSQAQQGMNFGKHDLEDKAVSGGLFGRLSNRIKPLLDAKHDIDKVWANGYFENHYPTADKLIKEIAHDRVLSALDHARSYAAVAPKEESDDENEKGVEITIRIGK